MFRTVLQTTPSESKITYSSSIMTIGSCFADTIGNQLQENKFHVLANPFGIIFNPLSIFQLVQHAINLTFPRDDMYLVHDEVHKNHELHSEFAATSEEELRLKIEGAIKSTHDFITNANWLVITFGTSVIYRKKSNSELVANCHKVPSSEFDRSILEEADIVTGFEQLIRNLQTLNPDIQILLTVSPVRHIKETLVINNLSKSILRVACHRLSHIYPQVSYFPAYEIMLDDLRDYRFYASDMLHPNDVAEQYIWDAFTNTYIDHESRGIMEKWEKVKKSLEHRPFFTHSKRFEIFRDKTLQLLEELLPYLDVNKEISNIKKLGNER